MPKGMAQLAPSNLPVKKLEGKVAIVTGGASGIGEATARLFADHGIRAVVIADIQDEKGQEVAESIGAQQCRYFHCNVRDEEQVKGMVEWTVQTYGKLDFMFSNAGTHGARVMVERRIRGSIVCTASVAASRGGAKRTDYIMAKQAVLGLVRCASIQLGVHGIRVNSVSPSAIATPLTSDTSFRTRDEDIERIYEPLTSLKGILLKVRHIADAVLFLVSEDSAFITGHDLVVDGGLLSLPGPNHFLVDENQALQQEEEI